MSLADLQSRSFSRIDVSRPLRLVDPTGAGLAQLGTDARLFAGDYGAARQWALAFFRHPSQPDGIYDPSRHDNERACLAIFSRVEQEVTAVLLGTLTDRVNAALLRKVLAQYRFGLGVP